MNIFQNISTAQLISILGGITALVGAIVSWRKARHDDVQSALDGLDKLNARLNAELTRRSTEHDSDEKGWKDDMVLLRQEHAARITALREEYEAKLAVARQENQNLAKQMQADIDHLRATVSEQERTIMNQARRLAQVDHG